MDASVFPLVFFNFAITMHMIEEVIWLPAWSQDAGKWHEPVARREFAIASGVLLTFLYLNTFLFLFTSATAVSLYLLCGLAVVMMANLFIPHLCAAIDLRRYAPGLATSMLLVVPAASLLLFWVWVNDFLSMPLLLLVGVGFLLGTVFIWPALFRVGKLIVAD